MTIMVTGNTKETGAGVNSQRHKGGRPTLPKARRRSKSVTVKFFDKRSDFVGYSKIDYETLRVRCRKTNRRLSEYIRESALQSEVVMPHTTENASLYRELAGMANNLNQLARLSHQTSLYHTSRKVDEALERVLAIINEYKQGKEGNG